MGVYLLLGKMNVVQHIFFCCFFTAGLNKDLELNRSGHTIKFCPWLLKKQIKSSAAGHPAAWAIKTLDLICPV